MTDQDFNYNEMSANEKLDYLWHHTRALEGALGNLCTVIVRNMPNAVDDANQFIDVLNADMRNAVKWTREAVLVTRPPPEQGQD